jgi:hypothetical protein
MAATLDNRFRPSPGRPGFWLLRPFGQLPLVLEFSDAGRQRYLERLRRWRLMGLCIGAPLAWLAWRMAGELAALGVVLLVCIAVMAWTWREARRVPASAWPDDPAMDATAAALQLGFDKVFAVVGIALLAVAIGGLTVMALRHGVGRWDILLVPLGLLALVAVQVAMSLRKWRASIRAARPPQS